MLNNFKSSRNPDRFVFESVLLHMIAEVTALWNLMKEVLEVLSSLLTRLFDWKLYRFSKLLLFWLVVVNNQWKIALLENDPESPVWLGAWLGEATRLELYPCWYDKSEARDESDPRLWDLIVSFGLLRFKFLSWFIVYIIDSIKARAHTI